MDADKQYQNSKVYGKEEKKSAGRVRCGSICNFRFSESDTSGGSDGSVLVLLQGRKLGKALQVVRDVSRKVGENAFEGAIIPLTRLEHPSAGKVCSRVEWRRPQTLQIRLSLWPG